MSTDKKAEAAAASASADTGSGTRAPGTPSAAKVAYTRRFPRFNIDMRLQVKMFQAGEFRTCWGRSTEMGQDGIGATLTGSLEPGEIVTLKFPCPSRPTPSKCAPSCATAKACVTDSNSSPSTTTSATPSAASATTSPPKRNLL